MRLATSHWDVDGHFTVRHAVFVEEQAIFSGSDVDDRDFEPGTLHAVAATDDLVVGAVRLYRTDAAGTWRGDRLAALVDHRRRGTLGARLVRFAVATAGRCGGTRMDALIQMPNVRFFHALGWSPCGDLVVFHGVPHQPMDIPLSPGP
ncbi:MAG: GNAT family N-acetyltransferase [Thermoleophilia bacterium]|nr:GNAT family N-acetyltransferase [Thermoleophilia bacterium]